MAVKTDNHNISIIERIPPFLFPLGLFLLGILVYASSFGHDLLLSWNDNQYITENPTIQTISLDNLADIWTNSPRGEYIPLTYLSYMVNYAIAGDSGGLYHAFNAVFHAINGVLVFLIINKLQDNKAVALIAAILFVVHPLQVETVSWIAARKILLSTTLLLVAFWIHIRATHPFLLILGWVFFAGSILAYPIGLLAPIFFLMIDWYWKDATPKNLIWNIPYVLISIIGGIIFVVVRDEGLFADLQTHNPLEIIQLVLWAIGDYTVHILAPFDLQHIYTYDLDSSGISKFLLMALGGAVSLSLVPLALFQPLGRHITLFGTLWVVIFWLPLLFPLGFAGADRFFYLPSVMLFGLLAIALSRLGHLLFQQNQNMSYLSIAVLGIVILLFSGLSISRSQAWKNSEALWTDYLEEVPMSLTALQNLGVYYLAEDDYSQAADTFDQLIAAYPNYPTGYYLRGVIADQEQNYGQAVQFYIQALALAPNDPNILTRLEQALVLLGESEFNAGNYRNTLQIYQQALEVFPNYAALRRSYGAALLNIGVLLFEQGNYENALRFYLEAINFIPNEPVLHNNIGFTYYTIGQYERALVAYQRALELDRFYARAWINLGNAALSIAEFELARNAYQQAIQLNANLDAQSASNFCLSSAEMNDNIEVALAFCNQAIEAEPNNSLFLGRTAHVLLLYGRFEEALEMALRAVEVDPNLSLNQRTLGDAHRALGNVEAARAAYQAALAIDPTNQAAQQGLAALSTESP